jgi:hypothetical protein
MSFRSPQGLNYFVSFDGMPDDPVEYVLMAEYLMSRQLKNKIITRALLVFVYSYLRESTGFRVAAL